MLKTEQIPSFLSGSDYLKAILRAPIYDVVKVTPLEEMSKLSERTQNRVWIKREDLQQVHSFKIRGAYNMIEGLSEQQKMRGIIAASAGNHAQGVAFSANKLGIRSLIVMPITTPDIKVEAVRYLGSDVLLFGQNFDEAKIKAIELAEQKDYTFIPPFDHPAVITGQGTIGMELLQQNSRLDRIFLPVGGGGLAAGVAVLIKQIMPEVKIIGVEAADSACLSTALKKGAPYVLDKVGLFADGVAVKRIGDETFRLCQTYLDDVVTVESDEICAAIKDIFDDTRAIAEPAGALALAGLKKYVQLHQIQNEHLAHILSGANLNFHSLRYVSERCELGEQRQALFSVIIPEERGSFLAFSELLGVRAITEFNYRHGDDAQARIFVGIRLHNGAQERLEIRTDLENAGYQVEDLSDNEIAKLHVRYMVGGSTIRDLNERVFSFIFPESSGALLNFLRTLGTDRSISMFHYHSDGMDYSRVLVAFEVEDGDNLIEDLQIWNYEYSEESDNPALRFFLQ